MGMTTVPDVSIPTTATERTTLPSESRMIDEAVETTFPSIETSTKMEFEASTSTEREDETSYVTEQTSTSAGADIDFTPTEETILEIESISTTTAMPIETTTIAVTLTTGKLETDTTVVDVTTDASSTVTTEQTTEGEEQIHELQCKPDASISSDETVALKCKEADATDEDEEPITVLVSSGLLDLGSFDRSRFKIVVKDLMLMEMK